MPICAACRNAAIVRFLVEPVPGCKRQRVDAAEMAIQPFSNHLLDCIHSFRGNARRLAQKLERCLNFAHGTTSSVASERIRKNDEALRFECAAISGFYTGSLLTDMHEF